MGQKSLNHWSKLAFSSEMHHGMPQGPTELFCFNSALKRINTRVSANFTPSMIPMNLRFLTTYLFFFLLIFTSERSLGQQSSTLEIISADLLQGANGF